MFSFARIFITLISILLLFSCNHIREKPHPAEDIISQKLLIDIRYFCESPVEHDMACKKPVTKLPGSLKKLLSKRPFGGIILFAENFESIEQTVRLTDALQKASLNSNHKSPLLITTDQEGGAVTRLPPKWSTDFAGNMAIAAVATDKREEMAYLVGRAIGTELHALGLNVNHAPVLDVNSDPNNPVIHVRSFSDKPHVVSVLGSEMARGLASAGIAPSAKHFPGHGNTAIDSHLGLPTVSSDRETVVQHDLAPFTHLIKKGLIPIIMTAHIQYPALDSSLVAISTGEKVPVPATLSRKIITDLLRGELNYQGVVISDAMNMKAISSLFSPVEASLMAFNAGVDLALMPVIIRSPADFDKLDQYIAEIAKRLPEQQIEWENSVRRINRLKAELEIERWANRPLKAKISEAETIIGSRAHHDLSYSLASKALSFVHGERDFIPINKSHYNKISIIFPKPELAQALRDALYTELGDSAPLLTAYSLSDLKRVDFEKIIEQSDLVILGNSSPKTSLAELGGMEDWKFSDAFGPSVHTILQDMVRIANLKNIPNMYISFGFPYELSNHLNTATYRIAAYNDKVVMQPDGTYTSATIRALSAGLSGQSAMPGIVPIDLSTNGNRPSSD